MASQDDMKVGVLADLADIEQQGVRAGEAFKKGFGQGFGPGGIGGALLGNGMAPTQGPAAPGDSVASILDKILQSLDTGFARLLEASGGGLGGGAATGGGGGGAAPQPAPQPAPDEGGGGGGGGGRRGGGFSMSGVLGAANMFPQQSYANAYNSGFYGTNVAQFAAAATSNVPLVGQFLGVVANTMQQRDSALRDLLGVYRGGGKAAWSILHNEMTGSSSGPAGLGGVDMLKQYGVDRSEAAQLMMLGTRAGQAGNFEDLVRLQGLYGMGQQGAGLMGTINRGGGSQLGSTETLFANVLATAIGTNLDRGRWGEAFEAISKAAGRITTGNVDTQGVFGMMNFVGSMGARFRGDTQASADMVGMLQGMQGGQGGQFGNLAALQAAGLGKPGVSFTDAWMRVQRGAAEGGVGLRDVLKQYEQLPVVQRYLTTGAEGDLSTAVFVLSRLAPQFKPTDIEALLRSMRTQGYQTGESFGAKPGAVDAMRKALRHGTIPQKERELIASEINNNMQWSEAAIGRQDQDFTSPENPGGMPETLQDLERAGAMRTGPAVEMVDRPSGTSMTSESFMQQHVSRGGQYGAQRKDTPFHPGVDIQPTKPGDPIYCPCNGEIIQVIGSPTRADQGAPGFGLIIREDAADGGRIFRIFHIDPTTVNRKALAVGKHVSRGQILGRFFGGKGKSRGFQKTTPIHTHVGVQRPEATGAIDATLDPATQFNLEDVLKPAAGAGDAPAGAGASPGPVTSPSQSGGPSAMMSPPSMDVNIYVYDGRISVQKSASKAKRPGDPNRMYGTKIG